jgi:hypothetical protein
VSKTAAAGGNHGIGTMKVSSVQDGSVFQEVSGIQQVLLINL